MQQDLPVMSKQLALSAALSVLAMVGFAFFAAPAATADATSTQSLFSASAPASVVPSLGTLLPGLR
jgi:hypothetical protein